jgi:photosystem II stability/assembly factor-like uncharacterized protein
VRKGLIARPAARLSRTSIGVFLRQISLVIVFLLASLVFIFGQAPRLDTWQVVGPGGGGTMIAPTISPHDPRLVLEHCDMTGGYISNDDGDSWRMFNLLSGLDSFAFDPTDKNVIYAANVALWRSENRGKSWSMIFPDPPKNTVEHQVGDHSDVFLTTADGVYPGAGGISAVAVDPHDSNRLYIAFTKEHSSSTAHVSRSLFSVPATAATKENSNSWILVSVDHGISWKRLAPIPQSALLLTFDNNSLVVVAGHGAYSVSREGVVSELGQLQSSIFAVSAAHMGTATWLYATAQSGDLYLSENGGRNWRDIKPSLGQSAGKFEAVATSEQHPRVAYVGFRDLRLGLGNENLFNGIAKTEDAGHTWHIVFKESTKPAENLEGTWIEQRATQNGVSIFFDSPRTLGVAPTDPHICYATDLFRTYRTLDGGKSWKDVSSRRVDGDQWTTRGLDVTTNYGVQFDPFDPKHIYMDNTDMGLFQSGNGGASWQSSSSGVPEDWRNTAYWLAFDPQVKGLVWGAFSGVHDLPRTKDWRRRSPLSFTGGIAVSTDGGWHWTPSNHGMPSTSVTDIQLDPNSPAGKRTLYATGFGHGVYKSVDNGNTWALKNNGIAGAEPFAWRLTLTNPGTLYLVIARRSEGRNPPASGDGALYRSTDKAEHWVKMNLPAGTNGPTGLAVDPRNPQRLYLTAWGREGIEVDHGGGVFLSIDAGQTWTPIFQDSQHVYDLTLDPRNPKILYICGFDSAAYRSADGGIHWTRLKGYNFKWGHRVILDSNDTSKIYITTYGGGVWHGPALGDPRAQGDVLTPIQIAH